MAQTGSVRGTVRSVAGEPLAGAVASIAAFALSDRTDSAGAFLLHDVPAGARTLVVRMVGLRTAEVRLTVRAGEVTTVAITLEQEVVTLAPITTTVRGPERERFEDVAQGSTVNLNVRDIASVPALGERDLMRAVQLLPGVVARNDFSVGLNVRGGDADQNLVLLDGQPVFNPFHLGGLFSTFADDAVDGLEFMTGGFPARYGGRLSSVLDVTGRPGSMTETRGSVSVSLLATKLHFEGPLPGGTGSWIVAGRRTYADQVVAALSPDEFPYHFQDLVGRLTIPRFLGGSLAVSAFGSGDYFNFVLTEANSGQKEQSFVFDWGNRVLGATYTRPLGARTTFTQRAGRSTFFADVDVGPGLFGFTNRVRRLGLSGDLEVRGRSHTFAAGYVLERHDIDYFAGSPATEIDVARVGYHPRTLDLYVEDQWHPIPSLLVRPGLRFTGVLGGRYARVAPRFNAKLFVTPNTALTLAAGRYVQTIQSLRQEEIPISLFEFWVGTDSTVPVGQSDHVIGGVERWLNAATSVQVEGYWKRSWNLIDGDPTEDPTVVGDEFITARSEAWGGEVYLRRSAGRVTGWLSYSLGWVNRVTETGERYPPAQDRRHTFNAVASWRWILGARWTARLGYGSPLPYTGIAGEWVHRFYDPGRNTWIGATLEPYRTARNSERYPAYSRLDLSAQWEFGWLGARWKPTASLLNAYARTNVFVYFYDYGSQPPNRRGFSQFPFIPTVGIDIEF